MTHPSLTMVGQATAAARHEDARRRQPVPGYTDTNDLTRTAVCMHTLASDSARAWTTDEILCVVISNGYQSSRRSIKRILERCCERNKCRRGPHVERRARMVSTFVALQ